MNPNPRVERRLPPYTGSRRLMPPALTAEHADALRRFRWLHVDQQFADDPEMLALLAAARAPLPEVDADDATFDQDGRRRPRTVPEARVLSRDELIAFGLSASRKARPGSAMHKLNALLASAHRRKRKARRPLVASAFPDEVVATSIAQACGRHPDVFARVWWDRETTVYAEVHSPTSQVALTRAADDVRGSVREVRHVLVGTAPAEPPGGRWAPKGWLEVPLAPPESPPQAEPLDEPDGMYASGAQVLVVQRAAASRAMRAMRTLTAAAVAARGGTSHLKSSTEWCPRDERR
jgi:hypothetical protein